MSNIAKAMSETNRSGFPAAASNNASEDATSSAAPSSSNCSIQHAKLQGDVATSIEFKVDVLLCKCDLQATLSVRAVMLSAFWFSTLLGLGLADEFGDGTIGQEILTAILFAHAEQHLDAVSNSEPATLKQRLLQILSPRTDFWLRVMLEKCSDSPNVFISQENLVSLHKMSPSETTIGLASCIEQLHCLIVEIEERFYEETATSKQPIKPFFARGNEETANPRGMISGLVTRPHLVLYTDHVEIAHDGLKFSSRAVPGPGSLHHVFDGDQRPWHLHSHFQKASDGEPNTHNARFETDNQQVFMPRGYDGQKSLLRDRFPATPCAMIVNESKKFFDGLLSHTNNKGQCRPFFTFNVNSQCPSLELQLGGSKLTLKATFDQMLSMNLRMLPGNNVDGQDYEALQDELEHQWPGIRYQNFIHKQQWFGEVVVRLKRNQRLKLRPGNEYGTEQSEWMKFAMELQDAVSFSILVPIPGNKEHAQFQWLRLLVSSCKASTNGSLSSFWAYMQPTGVGSCEALARHLISTDIRSVSAPIIPQFMLRSSPEPGQSVMRGQISQPAYPNFATTHQLIMMAILGTLRSAQYKQNTAFGTSETKHRATFKSEGSVLTVQLELSPALDSRDLPAEGKTICIEIDAPPTSSRRRQEYRRRINVQGVISQSQPGSNCYMIKAQMGPSDEAFVVFGPGGSHTSGMSTTARIKLPRRFDYNFYEDLVHLLRLFNTEAHVDSDRFDIRPLLDGEHRNLFTAKLVNEHLPGMAKLLSDLKCDLDESQQSVLQRLVDGLPNGLLILQGSGGSGKSEVLSRIVLSIARGHRIKIVTTDNNPIDNLLGKILNTLSRFKSSMPFDLFICRAHPMKFTRGSNDRDIWNHAPKAPLPFPTSFRQLLYGNYHNLQKYDVWLERLVCSMALQITGDPNLVDLFPSQVLLDTGMSTDELCELCQKYSTARSNYDDNHSLVSGSEFDTVNDQLCNLVIATMDVVCTSIDHGSTLSRFDHSGVIVDEASMVSLSKTARCIVGVTPDRNPSFVILAGDQLQGGPIDISSMECCNEFADVMQTSILKHLDFSQPSLKEPSKRDLYTISLTHNYRNPISVFSWPKTPYEKKAGRQIQCSSDVRSRPYFRQVLTICEDGDKFLHGVLSKVRSKLSLGKQQFVWFDTYPECARSDKKSLRQLEDLRARSYATGGDATVPLMKATYSEVPFKRSDRYVIENVACQSAVFAAATDLVKGGVPPGVITIQVCNAPDKDRMMTLRNRNHPILAEVEIWSARDAQGRENDVVLTMLSFCHFSPVPPDNVASVLLTRANTFHFIFGNNRCIRSHETMHERSLSGLARYSYLNGHVVKLHRKDMAFFGNDDLPSRAK